MTKAILSNYAVTLFQHFGETEDFGQKNFGVSEKWLSKVSFCILNYGEIFKKECLSFIALCRKIMGKPSIFGK